MCVLVSSRMHTHAHTHTHIHTHTGSSGKTPQLFRVQSKEVWPRRSCGYLVLSCDYLSILCTATFPSVWTLLYAAHWSECTVVPGAVWAAAVLQHHGLGQFPCTPRQAAEIYMSIYMPKTHTSLIL